jgi:protein-S-isoprenylcysteine O-methyltransferase Ste14
MNERQTILRGAIFQLTMLASFFATVLLYGRSIEASNSAWVIPSYVGAVIFCYCLWTLYRGKGKTQLQTGGLFKITRHPMYTGFILMNSIFWLPQPASSDLLFFFLQFVFLSCLCVAGWFQEKETLARFGKEAEDYYAKTPRIFLHYPFTH